MKILIKPNNILSPLKTEEGVILVVYDTNGNPVLVVEELDNGALMMKSAGEKGFEEMLRMTGVNKERPPLVRNR